MTLKGKKFTEEHKRNISLARKGQQKSEEHKRKLSESHKGKKHSAEHIKSIVEARTKNNSYKCSEEHKIKIGKSNKGKIRTEEMRKKYSLANKGKHLSTEIRKKIGLGNKGKKYSNETKQKMSEAHKGEKSYLWRGGISFEKYGFDWTDDLKESIRKRDKYICQECGIFQDKLNKRLDVHHIDYNKYNLNHKNLISLCKSCHMKTNNNREYWIDHFNNIENYFKN